MFSVRENIKNTSPAAFIQN